MFLAAWVGVACPVLCAMRMDDSAPSPPSCCSHGQPDEDRPKAPDAPQDLPERCFCSAPGILAEKSNPFPVAALVQPGVCYLRVALEIQVSQVPAPMPPIAPTTYRVPPLLI